MIPKPIYLKRCLKFLKIYLPVIGRAIRQNID